MFPALPRLASATPVSFSCCALRTRACTALTFARVDGGLMCNAVPRSQHRARHMVRPNGERSPGLPSDPECVPAAF